MLENNERITYKQKLTSQELSGYIKAVLLPIAVFFLALIVISRFGAFGKNIMAPVCCAVWGFGVIVALKAPSQRKTTLNEVYGMIAGYCAGLYVIRILIGLAANTSSEQLMASYEQALPQSTGSTISGYLQSMLWILAFITPFTFLGVLAKKLISFRKTAAKDRVLRQVRGEVDNSEHRRFSK